MNLISPLSIRRRMFSLMACMLKARRRRSAQQYALAQAAEIMESRVVLTKYTADPTLFPDEDVSGVFPLLRLDNAGGFNDSGPVFSTRSFSQGRYVFAPNVGVQLGSLYADPWIDPNSLRVSFDSGASDFSIHLRAGNLGGIMNVDFYNSNHILIESRDVRINGGVFNHVESIQRAGADLAYVFVYSNGGSPVDINSLTYTIAGTDTTPPTVINMSPANGGTGVSVTSNLVLTFSESVAKGAGNILIKKSSDDSTVQTIDVTSSAVSISGSVVTINPADLTSSTGYHVTIPSTAFKDLSNNAFAGISGNSTWNFTTAGSATDDHGNTPATATPISVPSTTSGNLEVDEDFDYFKFSAVAGNQYTFTVSRDTLTDNTLELVRVELARLGVRRGLVEPGRQALQS